MKLTFFFSLRRLGLLLGAGMVLAWPLLLTAQSSAPDASQVQAESGPSLSSIESLVAQAMAQNPELAFYRAELKAAKAGRQTAGALAYPELSTSVGNKRVETRGGDFLGEGLAWQVSVMQPIEWPGRLSLRKAIANRDVELAELGLSQFQVLIGARIRCLAYGLYVAQEKAAAAREVAGRFQALQEVLLQRDAAGLTPLLETRIIEANALTLRHAAREAEQQVQQALLELNRLRGQPVRAPLIVAPAELAFSPAPPLEALMAMALTNNFDIRMRRAELDQQGVRVSLTRRERSSGLALGPYVAQERGADQELQVGVSVSVPLPLWQRSESNVSVAEAREEQAVTAWQVTIRKVEQDLAAQALAYQASLEEMERWPEDAVRRFREAAELADRHYRLGAVPVATYVELQKQYLEALEALLSTRGQALDAAQDLRLLTGAGGEWVKVTPSQAAP